MRKWTYIAASYVLLRAGEFVYWIMEWIGRRYEDELPEPRWIFTRLYRAYQWCALTSSDLDEWGVLWKPAPGSNDD